MIREGMGKEGGEMEEGKRKGGMGNGGREGGKN